MVDPVKGEWNYTYNAFGELYTQQTARNHTTFFNYDTLGRMTRRYEANEGTACWIYGTTANLSQKAVGKLLSKRKYAGSVNCSSLPSYPLIGKYYEYDFLGRVDKQNTRIASAFYLQSHTYDAYSRPLVTTYPSVYIYPWGSQTFATKTHYNSNGYSYKTTREGDNYVLSEVLSMNSRGQVTEMKNGNTVTTEYDYTDESGWLEEIDVSKSSGTLHYLKIEHDDLGNVTSRRSDYASSTGIGSDFTESYTYDQINRLTKRTIGVAAGASTLPSAFQTTQEYVYDTWGNFTEKTGVGHYKYNSTAVHELEGIYANSGFTGPTSYAFVYDNNGNVETDGTRNFTYGSFDKPTNITKGSASSDMLYGVDRELYYKKDITIENGITVHYTRYYIGAYEKVVRLGGNGNTTSHKYNIGNAVVAYNSGSPTATINFVHSDNQGSVIATTNASGQMMTQDIYDPFGKQGEVYRAPVYLTSLPPITDKGYTGHKQMNHVDIIHMGGRIYDPTLGRFLQADPFIQAPKNSQNYNRYSYVLNNPMSYTDPSGYFFIAQKTQQSFIKASVKVFGAEAVGIAGNLATIGCGIAGPVCALHFNYNFNRAMGVSTSGSLRAGFTAAISAYTFQQIGGMTDISQGTRVALHAFAGGITSELQGGKFGHGFISAGLTKAINVNGIVGTSQAAGMDSFRIVVAAAIGGTVSQITGGKFANGAITAAFAQAFNGNAEADFLDVKNSIGEAIRVGDYKKAVALATDYLGLDSTAPTDIVIRPNDIGNVAAGVDNEGVLSFYKDSFTSPERLISTVGHEYVHIKQWKSGLLGVKRFSQQHRLNQLEAVQWEIDNIEITGYHNGFSNMLDFRNTQFNNLTLDNQYSAIRGNYVAN